MGTYKDLTGKTFGRLTVISRGDDYLSPKGYTGTMWRCRCTCGNIVEVRGCNLRAGKSTSCGCYRKENPNRTTHGLSHTKLWNIWRGIKTRCENPNDAQYHNYGGRGITICDEWRSNPVAFIDWARANGYRSGLSIDRIDNNKGYSPTNCRWATSAEQANNTRRNRLIEYNGETHTLKQWSDITGIKYQKIKDRLNKCGWSVARALTTP